MTTTIHKHVLMSARALLDEPSRWTSGTLACSRDGQRVHWHDPAATRWCAHGALYRAAFDLLADADAAIRVGDVLARSFGPKDSLHLHGYLAAVNDRHGRAAVLALFDKAVAAQ